MSFPLVRKNKRDSSAAMRSIIRESAVQNGALATHVNGSTPRPPVRGNPRKTGQTVCADALLAEITRVKTYHETQRTHLRNINDLTTASLHTQKIDALADLLEWVNVHKS